MLCGTTYHHMATVSISNLQMRPANILGHLHRHLEITNIERLLATETVLCPLCSSKQEPLSSGDEEDDNSMPLDMYQHMTMPKNLQNRHKEIKMLTVNHSGKQWHSINSYLWIPEHLRSCHKAGSGTLTITLMGLPWKT